MRLPQRAGARCQADCAHRLPRARVVSSPSSKVRGSKRFELQPSHGTALLPSHPSSHAASVASRPPLSEHRFVSRQPRPTIWRRTRSTLASYDARPHDHGPGGTTHPDTVSRTRAEPSRNRADNSSFLQATTAPQPPTFVAHTTLTRPRARAIWDGAHNVCCVTPARRQQPSQVRVRRAATPANVPRQVTDGPHPFLPPQSSPAPCHCLRSRFRRRATSPST